MSFPAISAVSGAVEETAYLATDVVQGTRYAGKMYKLGMQTAYKAQLTESYLEQNSLTENEKLTPEQKAIIAAA